MSRWSQHDIMLIMAREVYANENPLSTIQRLDEIKEKSEEYACWTMLCSVVCAGLFKTSDPYSLRPDQIELFLYNADRIIQRFSLQARTQVTGDRDV